MSGATSVALNNPGPGCWLGKHGAMRCNVTANGCICSRGCTSSWKCVPSPLCDAGIGDSIGNMDHSNWHSSGSSSSSALQAASTETSLPPRVAILLFLTFNHSLVRDKYKKKPYMAYNREVKRIKWFLQSASRVKTRLPIHVIVGPERYADREEELRALGAHITAQNAYVPPPAFASSHHRLSFSKVGALKLTQFDKVFVFDNDIALVHNVDDLAFAPTPAAVWHTAVAQFQFKAHETCAVTTGLLGLSPSTSEFERAMKVLADMPTRASYDGGDQEFWRIFYKPWKELPLRYQAHQALRMPLREWRQVASLHGISGLRSVSQLPTELRPYINYYT